MSAPAVQPVESDPSVAVEQATDAPKDAVTEVAESAPAVQSTEEKTEKDESAAPEKSSEQDDKTNQDRKPKKDYSKNIKTNFTAQPETDDPEEIRKQVEFYFSDSNLLQDKFLLNQVGGSENRSVPIKVIHSFKRMRRFQPYSALVNALKDSEILEVVGDDEIKRKVPLPENVGKDYDESIKIYEDASQPRSIYAKGFGDEESNTQFDIEAFFMPYGPVNSVRLRRSFPEKHFKGSVFVEFDNEETQKAFLALDPKPKFNGKELLIMSKKEYCEMKVAEIKAGKVKPNTKQFGEKHGRRDDRRNGRSRGGFNGRKRGGRDHRDRDRGNDDWKERRKNFQDSRGRGRDQDGEKDEDNKKRSRDDADDAQPETKKSKTDVETEA